MDLLQHTYEVVKHKVAGSNPERKGFLLMLMLCAAFVPKLM